MANSTRDEDVQSRLQALQLETSKLEDENRSLHEQNKYLGERLDSAVTNLSKLCTDTLPPCASDWAC